MARQLDHMEDYYAQPEAKRTQYLAEDRARKVKESSKSTAAAPQKFSDDAQDKFVDQWAKKWSAEQVTRWETYRAAMKKAKAAATGKAT
jgi:hypothetical protein